MLQKQSKKDNKDQESVQSLTTPDLGHHMRKRQNQKQTQHKRVPRGEVSPLHVPAGDKNTARITLVNVYVDLVVFTRIAGTS